MIHSQAPDAGRISEQSEPPPVGQRHLVHKYSWVCVLQLPFQNPTRDLSTEFKSGDSDGFLGGVLKVTLVKFDICLGLVSGL